MSLRRFAAYFFAIAAGSTVVYASVMIAPSAAAEAAAAADMSGMLSPAETAQVRRIFQEVRHHSHQKSAGKIAQVALAK